VALGASGADVLVAAGGFWRLVSDVLPLLPLVELVGGQRQRWRRAQQRRSAALPWL